MKCTWLVASALSAATAAGFAQQEQNAPAQSEKDGVVKTDLYTVVEGYKVDHATMMGFRAWRAAACDRCHGANQQGLVGPSLIDSLKVLSKDDFKKTVTEGRLEKGMVSFKTSKMVMENLDNLYAYLKGRSDGVIIRSKVEELKE
ncbi:MAG TPA: cytochrome c [Acidiferrobacterales bacterium]|nr:cytochrome c [Acidiferrobacterales bacterium]